MAGRDYLVGKVTGVVDGETINVTVDRIGGGEGNGHRYNHEEKIRIKRLRLTDIVWMTGAFTRPQIEKMLRGKPVLCLIRSRESEGSILADVQLLWNV